MAEYINRNAVIEHIRKDPLFDIVEQYGITGVIESFPPADVQPVEYGEWTAEGNDEYGNYWDECTACRKAVWFPPFVKNDYKYCPHCGARMDGEA